MSLSRRVGVWVVASSLEILVSSCGVGDAAVAFDPAASDAGQDGAPCADGVRRCTGKTFERCTGGAFVPTEECGELACDGALGCVTCSPSTPGTCDGNLSRVCAEDGSGYREQFCDPLQGLSCSASTGRCVGSCSAQALGASYMGCDYFPAILPNLVEDGFEFAVIVVNESGGTASGSIQDGALTEPLVFDVPSGDALQL